MTGVGRPGQIRVPVTAGASAVCVAVKVHDVSEVWMGWVKTKDCG